MRSARIPPVLDGIASVSMTAAALTLIWVATVARVNSPLSRGAVAVDLAEDVEARGLTISVKDAPTIRTSGATLALIEFSDFECPFCRRYAVETLPQIKREFINTGKVAYIFKNFPIERIHPRAVHAAGAAACAGEQGRFWEMHGLLFDRQESFTPAALLTGARKLRLDESRFRACFDSIPEIIRNEVGEGNHVGISSTPTFLLGNIDSSGTVTVKRRLNGAHPFATFKGLIEELLKDSKDEGN